MGVGRRRNVAYQSHLLVSDPTSADMDSLQRLSSISDSSIQRVIISSIDRSDNTKYRSVNGVHRKSIGSANEVLAAILPTVARLKRKDA
jgi:hypothetical protein